MFKIDVSPNGEILLSGRFDAAQLDKAREVLDTVTQSSTIDFRDLEYISSAGLGLLLKTQKRLSESGNSLRLVNLNKHIRDVFRYAGFDTIFEIG